MPTANTPTSYGSVSRWLHWLIAILIFTAIPLGLVANRLPVGTDDELARAAWTFSFHKTIGVTVFVVALIRIAWSWTQEKPAPLHPERRVEAALADTVHRLLYLCLVLVPLSGWIRHASASGFAPIWWPFGQDLPLVPKSEALSSLFAALHWVLTKLLIAAVVLHVAGAFKHHFLDSDGTLARMITGADAGSGAASRNTRMPAILALCVILAAMALGAIIETQRSDTTGAGLESTPGEWLVESGTLDLTIRQLGTPVQGRFEDWTAAITFDPEAPGDLKGRVEVTIAIASLSLGAVTPQALQPENFDAAQFPTARFAAEIRATGETLVADGALTIKGITAPVALPFELDIQGDRATAAGRITLDRRTFRIGDNYADEKSLGFPVEVSFALEALRSPRPSSGTED